MKGHVNGTAATGQLIIPEEVPYNGNVYRVTIIWLDAFKDCTGLTGSLTIPNSVTEILGGAFKNCSGFDGTLTLSNNLRELYGSAFDGCHFTGSLVLPKTLEHIRAYTFYGCNFTGTITIPNSVTTIGEYAFCSSRFTRLVIGERVTDIGNYAFRFVGSGTGLNRVEILAVTPPTLGGNGVFGGTLNENLIVPCGCIPVYQTSEWNSVFQQINQNCELVEEANENISSVYPNPSHGLFKIEAENLKSVSIFNAIGRKVFETEASGDSFEYNFNGSTGMYLIRVETEKGVETNRVVVM